MPPRTHGEHPVSQVDPIGQMAKFWNPTPHGRRRHHTVIGTYLHGPVPGPQPRARRPPPHPRPTGITADTVLAPNQPFQRPDTTTTELVPLAVWQLNTATATTLPTINDLALGPDRRVYALSSHTQVIARLQQRLTPGDQAAATAAWQITDEIPGGRNARPEGLTFLPSGRPVIGIDTEQPDNNLVVLQALNGR